MSARLIEAHFDLLCPIYAKTAAYGHFGRKQNTDKAEALKTDAGL